MTGPPGGGTERSTPTPSRSAGIPGAVVAIALVLAFGLALRFIIAYSLLPGSGFITDINSFRAWAGDLASGGLNGFYDRTWVDYTPGYMYVLWLVGTVGNAIGGIGDLIKLPPILADVVIGWLVWSMTRELGARQGVALLGAAFAVLNPISWFDSAVWGQVDSFGVVFLLLALRELWRDRPERAAILTVVAAIIKPQLGILVPLVAVVTIRRALWPRGGYGDDPAPDRGETADPADPHAAPAGFGQRLRAWERQTGRPIRILTAGLAGFLTAVILSAPFGLTVVEVTSEAPYVGSGLLEQVGKAAGGYPYTTVNAYNPWALLPGDAGYSLASDGLWICDTDAVAPNDSGGDRCSSGTLMFGPIPALTVGTVLLLASFALVLAVVARHPDRRTMLVGLAILAMVFFVVPTRVHERYMFPFFALGAILAAVSMRWRLAWVALSVATFLNLYVVLTTLFDHSEVGVVDWLGIGEAIRSQAGVTVIAMIHLVGFAWAFVQLRADNRDRLADEIAEAGVRDAWPARAAVGAGTAASGTAALAHATGLEPPDATDRRPEADGGWRTPVGDALASIGLVDWIRTRLAARSVRADRTALLATEGGGRLDRLDVWLLIVLVVATLGLRTFRLSEPQHFHFDEVHHVQTAAEFLQAWRYGESQDIYEWTHPHLGKYAIAGGIALFGDDRISATSAIGAPVRDALAEPRRADPLGGDAEVGDLLYVATRDGVGVYDLRTRAPVAAIDLPGANRLAIDLSLNQLFVGTDDGQVLGIDLVGLPGGSGDGMLEPFPIGAIDGPVDVLVATSDGTTLLVGSGDLLSFLDRDSGQELASATVAGLTGVAEAGTGAALVATPADVTDPAAAATRLEDILGGAAADYEAIVQNADTSIIVAGLPSKDVRTEIEDAITAGELPGFETTDVSRIAAAGSEGLVFLDQSTGTELEELALTGGAHGIASVTVDEAQLYVPSGTAGEPAFTVVSTGGENDDVTIAGTHFLPGLGTRVDFDEASRQVHILGRTADGDGWTEYVIEPHANAVYADVRLPFEPTAVALDVDVQHPAADRQQLLAFAGDAAGSTAAVEIGQHAFGWRLPGVIAGALMAGLVFLLARILFRRREVAVLAAVFVLVDGMLFAHSRIGMIDAVLGLFIVAGYLLFAGLWTGRWRQPWAFWVLMPAVGLLLGLALATKWIGAYAIGGIVILLLVRSALGRLLLIVGLIGITVVLGYMAISVGDGGGLGNFSFLLAMIVLTLVAVVVTVVHPIAWSDEEFRLAVLAPAAGGLALFLGALTLGRLDAEVAFGGVSVTPLEVAVLLTLAAPILYGLFRLSARFGFGPLAPPPAPDDPVRLLEPPAPPPAGWLRPGWGFGLPLAWAALSLAVLPVAVYVASYLPWAAIENHQLWPGFPAGHTGQTLADLTGQMYRYHDQLTSAHAASSPWWAWPFDLKPVWFYQEGFDSGVTGAIYDAGNLVVWWMSVPALLFVAWQAFRRRSLALALIAIAFAAQWIPWARIDRAAFQYHYYTALPFVILALAYFAAELWHGPSRRTWMLAKAAAAIAIVAPALLHVFSRPLCWFAGVEAGAACPELIPSFVLTDRTAGMAVVLGLGLVFVVRGLNRLGRGDGVAGSFVSLALTAAGVAMGLVIVALLPGGELLRLEGIPVEPIALVVAIPLGYLAMQVLGGRDPRRFVGGLVVAAVATFVVFYPNLSGLPLPSAVANAYQGILPTYLYYFQFHVNTTPRNVSTPLLTPMLGVLAVALVVTCVVVAYSAWSWRLALAERAELDDADETTELRAGSPG